AIAWAKNLGITSGKTDGTFGVGNTVTREQVVTFLWNYAGQPEPQASASFDDVAADAYFAKAVAWAKEEGITSGIGGGKFGVGQVCAREQIVTLMYNYFAEK
ncbi:MAG: S-layer homology domain-containing protein, partial [Clostridia bacterium]|nr:S-layer homology domain-containing protein [Clostridia bacterium]